MSAQQPIEHNNAVAHVEDKNSIILAAAAKGAGLALVTGGLIAVTGARYSKTYQTLTRPMKIFLLGSGEFKVPLLLIPAVDGVYSLYLQPHGGLCFFFMLTLWFSSRRCRCNVR